jgi:hypothetical protein
MSLILTRKLLFIFTSLAAFIIYALTLAPTVTWRNDGVDSGDFATAVAVGGVPHPPGYPTYLILGDLFELLPFGDVAFRLNLLSAIAAALCVALLGLVVHDTLLATRIATDRAGLVENPRSLIWVSAAAAALTLAFSRPFWSQAVIAEVYALNALFAIGLLYGALQLNSANKRWLVPGLALLYGLGLGNHLSIVLVLPVLILSMRIRCSWQLLATSLLAFGAGLLVYLIIPLRAATGPPVNWGMASTWSGFMWLIKAELYHRYLFGIPLPLVLDRTIAELRLLNGAFIWWGIPISLLGLLRLVRRNPFLASGSIAVFGLISIYSIGYNTADSHVFLLPALLVVSLWLGWGLFDLGTVLQQRVSPAVGSRHALSLAILLLPLLSIWLNFADQDISRDDEAHTFAQRTLRIVEPEAIIVTDDDPHTFSLWYSRYGLGVRPDVAIINLNLLPHAWYRQTLLQSHSRLLLSDRADRPTITLSTLVEQNYSKAPIYVAILPPLPPLEGYHLKPYVHLQRVVQLVEDQGRSPLSSRISDTP